MHQINVNDIVDEHSAYSRTLRRRDFLRISAGAALIGLGGCGGDISVPGAASSSILFGSAPVDKIPLPQSASIDSLLNADYSYAANITSFYESQIKRKFDVQVMWSFDTFGTGSDQAWLDSNLKPERLAYLKNRGTTPLVKILAQAGHTPNFSDFLEKIIDGRYDSLISTLADTMRNHQDPVIFTLLPEVNYAALKYPTLFGGMTANQATTLFKSAWQRFHSLFAGRGATNVQWLYLSVPYQPKFTGMYDPSAFYPGDQYVDWIGMETYPFSTQSRWTDVFDPWYKTFQNYKKPLMVTEFASRVIEYASGNVQNYQTYPVHANPNGDNLNWMQDLLTLLPTSYPLVKCINYSLYYPPGMPAPYYSSIAPDTDSSLFSQFKALASDPHFNGANIKNL